MNSLSRWTPVFLSILRIVAGLLLLEHGTQKLFGFPPSGHGTVALASMMGVAGIIEFGGGLLVTLGLLTRPAAFICSGLMAVAYFMAHASGHVIQHIPPSTAETIFPILNKGEVPVIYCFVFLFLFVAGGGAWSIDAMMGRDRVTNPPPR